MASVYAHRNFYTEKLLCTEAFTHSKLLQKKFLHREAFLYIITTGIAAPKPDLGAKAKKKRDFEALFKRTFKRQNTSAKTEKIYRQITVAALMQKRSSPNTSYYLRDPAAKENSLTHAAAAPSNLDTATTMRPADTELQSTIELRTAASEIAAPKPDRDAKVKKYHFE